MYNGDVLRLRQGLYGDMKVMKGGCDMWIGIECGVSAQLEVGVRSTVGAVVAGRTEHQQWEVGDFCRRCGVDSGRGWRDRCGAAQKIENRAAAVIERKG